MLEIATSEASTQPSASVLGLETESQMLQKHLQHECSEAKNKVEEVYNSPVPVSMIHGNTDKIK